MLIQADMGELVGAIKCFYSVDSEEYVRKFARSEFMAGMCLVDELAIAWGSSKSFTRLEDEGFEFYTSFRKTRVGVQLIKRELILFIENRPLKTPYFLTMRELVHTYFEVDVLQEFLGADS